MSRMYFGLSCDRRQASVHCGKTILYQTLRFLVRKSGCNFRRFHTTHPIEYVRCPQRSFWHRNAKLWHVTLCGAGSEVNNSEREVKATRIFETRCVEDLRMAGVRIAGF